MSKRIIVVAVPLCIQRQLVTTMLAISFPLNFEILNNSKRPQNSPSAQTQRKVNMAMESKVPEGTFASLAQHLDMLNHSPQMQQTLFLGWQSTLIAQ